LFSATKRTSIRVRPKTDGNRVRSGGERGNQEGEEQPNRRAHDQPKSILKYIGQ